MYGCRPPLCDCKCPTLIQLSCKVSKTQSKKFLITSSPTTSRNSRYDPPFRIRASVNLTSRDAKPNLRRALSHSGWRERRATSHPQRQFHLHPHNTTIEFNCLIEPSHHIDEFHDYQLAPFGGTFWQGKTLPHALQNNAPSKSHSQPHSNKPIRNHPTYGDRVASPRCSIRRPYWPRRGL